MSGYAGSQRGPFFRTAALLLVALALAVAGLSVGSNPAGAATGGTLEHVKQSSLTDHAGDCAGDNQSGQLNVTNPEGVAFVSVTLTDDTVLGPDDVTYRIDGNTLKIFVPLSKDVYIKDAVIAAPDGWSGQFVLSHYNCGTVTPPPTCPDGTTSDGNGNCVPVTPPPPPNPPTPMCPNGTPWVDTNMNGLMDECGTTPPPPTPPFSCPAGYFYAGDLNHNGVMDEADCQAQPVPPAKLVYAKAKKRDKCGTAGDRFAVRASKWIVYKADGKRIKREGVWLKTHGDRKIVIKARSVKGATLVGPHRWVFTFGTNPCGKVPDTQAPSGAKRVA